MKDSAIAEAARSLIEARRTGCPLTALPPGCRPSTIADAHAVQDVVAASLGEVVAGWKVAIASDGAVMRGAILGSRIYSSPAEISATDMPLLGVEAEIAFLFRDDLAPRPAEYSAEEVAEVVSAMVVIEIVDSRFRSYHEAPVLDRLADCMSNGALVCGTLEDHWRGVDLARLEAVLDIDGETVVRCIGGHSAGDPLRPAVALANELRKAAGVRSGQIMTTGTYTGLTFAKPGQAARAAFSGFGSAEVVFTP